VLGGAADSDVSTGQRGDVIEEGSFFEGERAFLNSIT
jgi:hypothetical protein